VKEEILHVVWKYSLLNQFNCYSTDGEKIEVISPGIHNELDAGPDFSSAKVRVGDMLWVGNVEIHVKTSDWYEHLHHFDPSYQNVVLHVVYEDDCGDIEGTKKYPIIELKKCVDLKVWNRISQIEKSKSKIPCSDFINEVSSLDWIGWQDRLITERFERKVKEVQLIYKLSDKNWESVIFQLLAKSLGGTVNKEPFLILSKQVNISLLNKYKDRLLVIESILFGMSGMLDDHFIDLYPMSLKSEYSFHKAKHSLYQMESFWWKWLRLRPSSFPTIQIALLASLIHNLKDLELLFQVKSFSEFKEIMNENSCLSFYWENHYKFDHPSKEKTKNWGDDILKRIFINAVIPYQIAKNILSGGDEISNFLHKMNSLKYENNKVIRKWQQLNVPISTCYDSQAMLQLNKEYCSRKKCLNCNIGLRILKRSKYDGNFEENT
tara:strand:- start:1290 stop:2594 length:1305 start_codon:yes stop_codon:yes gene_type:complete